MALTYAEEFRDPVISRPLVEKIRSTSRKPIALMEVCGTHTVSIFRSGIRSLLPDTIRLLSGPGCPVCVTAQADIDAFIQLAGFKEVIITTFGDLMRVPGTDSTLQKEKAKGCDIRMVYSTFDALDIARQQPEKQVVFLGVGFETTAPTVAAAIVSAKQMGIDNFSVYSAHKLVPPALVALVSHQSAPVDGFILPGHVSVIIGSDAYQPFVDQYGKPSVVAGFEPADILQAIAWLSEMIEASTVKLGNAYTRAVSPEGNPKAQQMLKSVFMSADVAWRGLGVMPDSGLHIRAEFERYDAEKRFAIVKKKNREPKGCACGQILSGCLTPPECPSYKKVCTPLNPVGPCMVSTEGTCAAYYKYHVVD
jgi:hydrogenase expression/formation protein HypD